MKERDVEEGGRELLLYLLGDVDLTMLIGAS